MILGKDLLAELGLNLKLSENFMKSDDELFKGSTASMVDLGTYIFQYLNTEKITSEYFLPMLTMKKYMSQNIYVLTQNNYVCH